jgi:acetoacetyl-CoA synthetase
LPWVRSLWVLWSAQRPLILDPARCWIVSDKLSRDYSWSQPPPATAEKLFDLAEKTAEIVAGLPSVEATITVGESASGLSWDQWLAPHRGADLQLERFGLDHPGFILFSSGTTGTTQVHRAFGCRCPAEGAERAGLPPGYSPGDRVLYATTCGWMMWNWLMCGLGRGATIVLFDGSPAIPTPSRVWSLVDSEKLSFLGVSAALIDTWRQASLTPSAHHDVSALKTIASTGSPLAPSV